MANVIYAYPDFKDGGIDWSFQGIHCEHVEYFLHA